MALVVSAYSYAVPRGISLYFYRWMTKPVANAWIDAIPHGFGTVSTGLTGVLCCLMDISNIPVKHLLSGPGGHRPPGMW